MTKSVLLSLPIPPSVNAMFRNVRGRGRVKSKIYKDWLKQADLYLLTQKPIPKILGPYKISISMPPARGDLDNRQKALIDYLVSRGITDDDRYCRKATIERLPEIKMAIIEVEAA